MPADTLTAHRSAVAALTDGRTFTAVSVPHWHLGTYDQPRVVGYEVEHLDDADMAVESLNLNIERKGEVIDVTNDPHEVTVWCERHYDDGTCIGFHLTFTV